MAVLAAAADGNLTSSSTWRLVDSTSYLNSETGSETLTTAYSGTRSSAFTPGAITIDAIYVKLASRVGTTGTMSVSLYNNTGAADVAGTEVTINMNDLPAVSSDGTWICFKFGSSVTLAGATSYSVQAKTSSSGQCSLYRDGTADNISRALRTTTTQAPTTGDDMIISGEWTAAATVTSRTVTMNSTAATDYGSNTTSLVTPALSISSNGTLTCGTTAATNYVLRLSGYLKVVGGGTLNYGTSGTPMPRDSTAVLEFDCAADGDFGVYISNVGTANLYGLSRTSGKNITRCLLNTDEAASSTSLGVDTDTGWLSGDSIAIASTTQTRTQSETRVLNGNAGASSMDITAGLTNAHSGTSPTQAEVILLTRNVKVRSVSSTSMTFFYINIGATVNMEWVEFRYIGGVNSPKRGVDISTSSSGGTFSMSYCSIYNTESTSLIINNGNATNITINDLVSYNNATAFSHTGTLSTSNTALTDLLFMTCTACTFTGSGLASLDGFVVIGNSATTTIGGIAAAGATFDNITVHSANGFAFSQFFGSNNMVTNVNCWRNTAAGFQFSTNASNIVIDGLVLFGNTTTNLGFTGTVGNIMIYGLVSNGDTSFATTNGIGVTMSSNQIITNVILHSPDLSTVSGIKTAHTNDINMLSQAYNNIDILLDNPKLGAATEILNRTSMPLYYSNPMYASIRAMRKDQTDGNNIAWLSNCIHTVDTTIFNTASPSLRITPSSATIKADSNFFSVNVNDGQTCTPTVYVRKSVSGDGAAYNGNQPRLILLRNDAMGITANTVIDTSTASGDGAFEALTGTTATVIDSGVLQFMIDLDGTVGWVNIDDFSATVA